MTFIFFLKFVLTLIYKIFIRLMCELLCSFSWWSIEGKSKRSSSYEELFLLSLFFYQEKKRSKLNFNLLLCTWVISSSAWFPWPNAVQPSCSYTAKTSIGGSWCRWTSPYVAWSWWPWRYSRRRAVCRGTSHNPCLTASKPDLPKNLRGDPLRTLTRTLCHLLASSPEAGDL